MKKIPYILLFAIFTICACTLMPDKLSILGIAESSPHVIESSNPEIAGESSEFTFYNLQFYYHDESDELTQNYATGPRIEDDNEILNHYAKKLELNCQFNLLPVKLAPSGIGTLDQLDSFFEEHGHPSSDKIINIYLDTVWHNTTPNSFRSEGVNDNGRYIFMRKNELGNMPVLLHELIHFLVSPTHERTVDEDGNYCSYLPYHLTHENIDICDQYERDSLLAHCFNIMSESYYLPMNVFLTKPQKDWINNADCYGESSQDDLCDFTLPNGWRERLIDSHRIDTMSCCLVTSFTRDDISKFLNGMSNARSNTIYQLDSLLFKLLTCESETIIPDEIDSQGFGIPQADNNQNVFNLADEIESYREQVFLEYEMLINENILNHSVKEAEWEANFDYAKRFLIYWFRNSPTYKKWLEIESYLLCEKIRPTKQEDDLVAKDYYENQIKILNLAGEQLINEAIGNKRINISTGDGGEVDKNWFFVKAPDVLGDLGLPRQASIVPEGFKPNSWGNLPGADWISVDFDGVINGYNCMAEDCSDCEPYEFEYCFDLQNDAITTIDLQLQVDDYAQLLVDGPNGFVDTLYSACNAFDLVQVDTLGVYKVMELKAGKNCIKVYIYDWGVKQGFNLAGYIEGNGLLQ